MILDGEGFATGTARVTRWFPTVSDPFASLSVINSHQMIGVVGPGTSVGDDFDIEYQRSDSQFANSGAGTWEYLAPLKLLSVSFSGGRNIRFDDDSADYAAPHFVSPEPNDE